MEEKLTTDRPSDPKGPNSIAGDGSHPTGSGGLSLGDTMHPFEKAGLGLAPFRFVDFYVKRGPIKIENRDGTTTQVGAPGQPMGTCQYCYQGIANICVIESADGRRSEVGCDCVKKVGDKGLGREVGRVKREHERKRRQVRNDAKLVKVNAEIDAALSSESARKVLSAKPHPFPALASKGMTRLDWVEYMRKNAGLRGRTDAANYIKMWTEAA